MKITFDKNAKLFILESFDKTIDSEGYIIDAKSAIKILLPNGTYKILSGIRIKDIYGEIIHIDEFAGVRKKEGKTQYIKNDLRSIINLID